MTAIPCTRTQPRCSMWSTPRAHPPRRVPPATSRACASPGCGRTHPRLKSLRTILLHRFAARRRRVRLRLPRDQERRASGFHLGRHRPVRLFVGGGPTRPVWRGEIQGPALGMGRRRGGRGRRLAPPLAGVPRRARVQYAIPSMPLGFFGDDDGRRYGATYFRRFEGRWAHGDFAAWTEHADGHLGPQ